MEVYEALPACGSSRENAWPQTSRPATLPVRSPIAKGDLAGPDGAYTSSVWASASDIDKEREDP